MKKYDVDYKNLRDNSYNQESMTSVQLTKLCKDKNIVIYQVINSSSGEIIKWKN